MSNKEIFKMGFSFGVGMVASQVVVNILTMVLQLGINILRN